MAIYISLAISDLVIVACIDDRNEWQRNYEWM